MGRLTALEPGQRLLLPDTPPDLISPTGTTLSSKSTPGIADAARTRSLLSPPMSSYAGQSHATQASKSAEGTNRPQTAGHGGNRQQLPSLSSLFGPPSVRPLHSPMSDRGVYPLTSPLERPHPSAGERNLTNSYFPPTLSPPVSQSRTSYEPNLDAERHSLSALRRSTSGPGSPRFHTHSESHQSHVHRWSTHLETPRHEYTLDTRSRDQFHLHFPGNKEPSRYHEQRPLHNTPQTPTGHIPPEIVLSKDGLGPKIWTGTHFLPRFVRAAEVPGEGLCYFYDDGSHCKTIIDGEVVNAHWGVTKAGKPRKRLAIACVTCREKKIKCDPDYPRCVQCEKFGRICKFKNAPRGGHNGSPSTPPAELDDHRRLAPALVPESDTSSPVSPRATLHTQTSPDSSAKRLKVDHETYVPGDERSSPSTPALDHTKGQVVKQQPTPEIPRIPEDVLSRAWGTDPFVSDPQSISAVLSQFFAHIDSTMLLQFLPAETTKKWVVDSASRKSPEDLMLLYSILTVGVTLSGGPKHIAYEYAQVAHHAQKTTTVNCLQLAQSRILLAVHYISVSRHYEANEMMSAAAAAIATLQLNLEFDQSREEESAIYPIGLNKAGYCEARRRTLWSLFMLERLNGVYPNRLTMINKEDVYIRLPADAMSFEAQLESHASYFNPNELSVPKMSESSYEIAAYLVEMVHLWAESQSFVYRLTHRLRSAEAEAATLDSLVASIQKWHSTLPSRLLWSRDNLQAAAVAGNIGSYLTMHLLHNHAMIKIHRYNSAPRQLPAEAIKRRVETCYEYGTRIWDTVDHLDSLLRARPMTLSVPPPMVAAAVAEAVDVLTASQPLSHIDEAISRVRVVKPLVDTMGNVWEESRAIRNALAERMQDLRRILDTQSMPKLLEADGVRLTQGQGPDGSPRWLLPNPLDKMYGKEMDVLYAGLY